MYTLVYTLVGDELIETCSVVMEHAVVDVEVMAVEPEEAVPGESSSVIPSYSRKHLPAIEDIEDIVQEPTVSPYFKPIQAKRRSNKDPNNFIKRKSRTITSTIKENDTNMSVWKPPQWELTLENIRKMRSQMTAPVDTMGCDKCADENADEKTQRYQKLVALMLSSQTKDEITYEAMCKLHKATKGLTPENIVAMDVVQLEELLQPVCFYKNKAKYLKKTSQMLIDIYSSDIPDDFNELLLLPGVGPKMAHICMSVAWNQTSGIGVDVHVNRIVNRLRWIPNESKDPEKTRRQLEAWLPPDLWKEVNHLLVGFGQTICTATRPKCNNCLNADVCPASSKKKSKKSV